MPNVNLTYSNGTVQNPGKVTVTSADQTITWVLHPSAASFAAQPIVFPTPPPSGYNHWPGGTPAVSGNNVTVDTKQVLSPEQAKQSYKYNIVWNGGELDPDIENVAPPIEP